MYSGLFFLQLPRMENYSTVDYELRVNIARVFVLRIANLAALIFSLHRKIQEVSQLLTYMYIICDPSVQNQSHVAKNIN